MMPPPDLKARVLAAVTAKPAPTREAVVGGIVLAWVAAATVAVGIFIVMGGLHAGNRPIPFLGATASGWLAIAIAATLGATRRDSMLGRSRAALVAVAVGIPVALFAWYAVWLWCSPVGTDPVPMARGAGCLALTLAMGAAPFGILVWFRRDSDPVHPRAAGAAIGAMAGAWASVLIGFHCEHAQLLHVTVGHIVPVALLAAFGALFGERIIGLRSDAVAEASQSLPELRPRS
jgi:hypothetical protein